MEMWRQSGHTWKKNRKSAIFRRYTGLGPYTVRVDEAFGKELEQNSAPSFFRRLNRLEIHDIKPVQCSDRLLHVYYYIVKSIITY